MKGNGFLRFGMLLVILLVPLNVMTTIFSPTVSSLTFNIRASEVETTNQRALIGRQYQSNFADDRDIEKSCDSARTDPRRNILYPAASGNSDERTRDRVYLDRCYLSIQEIYNRIEL